MVVAGGGQLRKYIALVSFFVDLCKMGIPMSEAGRWSWLGCFRTMEGKWHRAPKQLIPPHRLRCYFCTLVLSLSRCSWSLHSIIKKTLVTYDKCVAVMALHLYFIFVGCVNPYGQPDRKKTVFYVKMLTLDSIGNSCDVLNSDLPGQWHLQPRKSNSQWRSQWWVRKIGFQRWLPARSPPQSPSHCPMGASSLCHNTLSPWCPPRRLTLKRIWWK